MTEGGKTMRAMIGGLLAALALAGCGQSETAAPAAETVTAAEAAPADPGRGAMLAQRADAIQARLEQAIADGKLSTTRGQTAQGELNAARDTLSAMLAQTEGPLPAESRMLVAQAKSMIEDGLDVEAAILDVNLAGESSFPLADLLAAKGVPFVFATGYGSGGLPESWRDRPTLQKPFSHDEVGRMLKLATGR